jgi:protein-tyrosine phosphatase
LGTQAAAAKETRMTVALSRLNFRDLGGLPAAGGVLRHHALFRSEGPASFLDDHHAELERLGIRLICDLRAPVEREAAPHRWPHTARTLHLDLTNDLRSEAAEGWAALRDDPSEAGALRAMTLNYAAMPAALHPQLAPLADALLDGGLPVLIHCTAGKDRTGVVTALALADAGVERSAIVADYAASADRYDALMRRLSTSMGSRGLSLAAAVKHRPKAITMERFLNALAREADGVAPWLAAHGWTEADHAALRHKLVGDSSEP